MTLSEYPRVAVFDSSLPPSLAFVRSLGRRGVPVVAYDNLPGAAAKYSRHADSRQWCPPIVDADAFIGWLIEEFERDRFDLIALTSDYAAFNVIEAAERAGWPMTGLPDPEAVRTCLVKDHFAQAMAKAGFPTPDGRVAATVEEAIDAADEYGYPVLLKPRSHAGLGVGRGIIVNDRAEMLERFGPFPVYGSQQAVFDRYPDIANPLVQRMIDGDRVEVISVTGVLAPDGEVLEVGHCRKAAQWYGRLGTGAAFEVVGPQPFTDHAVEAVQAVLGAGIFELEVLVDRDTGAYWAIDLNPRAFGQISLDVGSGRDLPGRWFESITGLELPPVRHRVGRRPVRWYQGPQIWAAAASEVVSGPGRLGRAKRFADDLRIPHVGSMADATDPLPGLLFGMLVLRHPRALIRSVGAKDVG